MEGPVKTEEITEPELLSTRQYREGATLYIFKNIGVVIDTSGKNYKPLPELYFGPYDNINDTGTLDQPEESKSGVNMKYVSQCIQKVVAATGMHSFWFYPYGDDSPTNNPEQREKTRLRLFTKHSPNIKPAPEGHGYILTV